MPSVLITGSAGFIGFHLSRTLLNRGFKIIGLDNLNNYYDVQLKRDRLSILVGLENFKNYELDLLQLQYNNKIFEEHNVDTIIHLAAQAGVRYSLENPHAYVNSNLCGFMNILEVSRHNRINHLIYASSSSVYGLNSNIPFSTSDRVDHPLSIYAASKKSNELMAHSYSHLFNIPVTGLRFFSVYGPWGRPDMALFMFTKSILEEKPINVFNYGKMSRDITIIDDIVEGIIRILDNPPQPNPDWNGDPSTSLAPYKIYNIGNNQPVELLHFIEVLEETLDKKAIKEMLPMQIGDVPETYADIDDLVADVGFKPSTSIEEGIARFADWFKWYYNC